MEKSVLTKKHNKQKVYDLDLNKMYSIEVFTFDDNSNRETSISNYTIILIPILLVMIILFISKLYQPNENIFWIIKIMIVIAVLSTISFIYNFSQKFIQFTTDEIMKITEKDTKYFVLSRMKTIFNLLFILGNYYFNFEFLIANFVKVKNFTDFEEDIISTSELNIKCSKSLDVCVESSILSINFIMEIVNINTFCCGSLLIFIIFTYLYYLDNRIFKQQYNFFSYNLIVISTLTWSASKAILVLNEFKLENYLSIFIAILILNAFSYDIEKSNKFRLQLHNTRKIIVKKLICYATIVIFINMITKSDIVEFTGKFYVCFVLTFIFLAYVTHFMIIFFIDGVHESDNFYTKEYDKKSDKQKIRFINNKVNYHDVKLIVFAVSFLFFCVYLQLYSEIDMINKNTTLNELDYKNQIIKSFALFTNDSFLDIKRLIFSLSKSSRNLILQNLIKELTK